MNTTIKTKYALLGSDLELATDIEIVLDETNSIVSLENHDEGSNLLAIPGFFNAHVHAADIGIRGQVGTDLHAVVGPGGIKQQYLSNLNLSELTKNISKAREEGQENGVLGFADFREGGLEGVIPYKSLPNSYIPYSRPKSDEILKITKQINIGIRDVVAYEEQTMIQLVDRIRELGGLVHIHVSEDDDLRRKWFDSYQVSDLIWAVNTIKPDAVVHATLSDEDDIDVLQSTDTGVIICPSSNQYFNVGIPPVQQFLNAGITVALGSDNAMVNEISLWKEFELLQKWNINSKEIVSMGTINGASLAGLDWGIEIGNSNFILLEIPDSLVPSDIFDYIISPTSKDKISSIFVPS